MKIRVIILTGFVFPDLTGGGMAAIPQTLDRRICSWVRTDRRFWKNSIMVTQQEAGRSSAGARSWD